MSGIAYVLECKHGFSQPHCTRRWGRRTWCAPYPGATATALPDDALRDLVIGFLHGYTGPPEAAADELIRMIRRATTNATQIGADGE